MEYPQINYKINFSDDEILYFTAEIRGDRNVPHTYANEPLAEAVYKKIRKIYPSAKIHREGENCYICATRKAEEVLLRRCRVRLDILEAQICEVKGLMERLEGGSV